MILENIKLGDKFRTCDGRIVIVIEEHKIARKHWYDFMCIDNTPYKFSAYDDGTAFEGFDWLDIIEKFQ